MKLFGINKSKVSIDFGSSRIKVVEGQFNRGKIDISKSLVFDLAEDMYRDGNVFEAIKIAELLKANFKNLKISDGLGATAVVNSSSIITREVSIPMVARDEIESIIEFQLADFLPINPDDYVVNHLILGTRESEGVEQYRVMLIAIPKGTVLSHLELMREADLKPEILDFQPNSIAKLLNSSTRLNDKYDIRGKTIACTDIGHASTSISIVKEGLIEVTRSFELGVNSIHKNVSSLLDISLDEAERRVNSIRNLNSEEEEFEDYDKIINLTRMFLDNLMENVQSVVRYYISRSLDNKIDLILLQGGYANLNGICQVFSENLNLDCLKLNSLDSVKFDGDLSLYANAIGGLIRRDEVKK